MNTSFSNRKDMAEFFRLGLLADLCEVSAVVRWADSIVAAEPSPHIAFIELCIATSQPASRVETLLGDVPGPATPELPVRVLLGYASRLVSSHVFTPVQLLLRLYRIANRETFPERIYFDLVYLEDDYSLVRDGIHGTLAEVTHAIITFLMEFEAYGPDAQDTNA